MGASGVLRHPSVVPEHWLLLGLSRAACLGILPAVPPDLDAGDGLSSVPEGNQRKLNVIFPLHSRLLPDQTPWISARGGHQGEVSASVVPPAPHGSQVMPGSLPGFPLPDQVCPGLEPSPVLHGSCGPGQGPVCMYSGGKGHRTQQESELSWEAASWGRKCL